MKIESIPKNIFTIHGLWPEHSSGEHMVKCNEGPEIKIQDRISDLSKEMNEYWLSYQHSSNIKFWTHEYNQHGYCYIQTDPRKYFETALHLFKKNKFDQLMINAYGNKLQGKQSFDHNEFILELKKALKNFDEAKVDIDLEIQCEFFENEQYLKEVRFLFDLDFNPLPLRRPSSNCLSNKNVIVEFK